MSAVTSLIDKLKKEGIIGDKDSFRKTLTKFVKQYRRDPLRFSNVLLQVGKKVRKQIPEEIRNNKQYSIYVNLSEMLVKEFLSKRQKEKSVGEVIENFVKLQTEIQVLESFAKLSKEIKKMVDVEHRLGILHNVTFLTILYLTIYERIGFRIDPIARELLGKRRNRYYFTAQQIEDLKKYGQDHGKNYSILFESMRNHIRNAVAHGTYRIDQKRTEIIFMDRQKTEVYTFQDFDKLLLDIRTLLFAIYVGFLESHEKDIKMTQFSHLPTDDSSVN